MAHISYSELKNWNTCPFLHKLQHIDKIDGFTGNEYTAFGTAIHSVCEKKLLEEKMDEDYFVQELRKNILDLDDDLEINKKLVVEMVGQGKRIIPEVDSALIEAFGSDYEVVSTEELLMVPIEGHSKKFKGFIDAVIKTSDGKIHIVDWKTCSWGWNAQRKGDAITTYQLTLYKHFWCKKHDVDPSNVMTHFALLKRTAKSNIVEFFAPTSGPIKTKNATALLQRALKNIDSGTCVKNKLSCTSGFGCKFYKTEHCP
jgi:hypothetical protein